MCVSEWVYVYMCVLNLHIVPVTTIWVTGVHYPFVNWKSA